MYYGKRPVFLVSSAMLIASTAWAARANSFESLLASTAVLAIAGGSTEALGAAIVNVGHLCCPSISSHRFPLTGGAGHILFARKSDQNEHLYPVFGPSK